MGTPRDCCFNPDVGFCSVATPGYANSRPNPTSFQSRCGFLLRRDIPARVVSVDILRFNPGVGFCSVATIDPDSIRKEPDRFNPGVGFCSVATVRPRRRRARRPVSIPVWVSAPSRPGRVVRRPGGLVFQSRCGFLLRRDLSSLSSLSTSSACFNPGVGFCSVATKRLATDVRQLMLFQSRCGFLLRRDRSLRDARKQQVPFQSRCGFLLRRDDSVASRAAEATVFQSRCGFLLRRDPEWSGRSPLVQFRFNPGVGFCSVATERRQRGGVERLVSIPVWVSAPSRQFLVFCGQRLGVVSIPVWVSAPSRPRQEQGPPRGRVGFQSRCGFLLRRDLTPDVPERLETRFNPGVGFCSVATIATSPSRRRRTCFNPGVGFCSVATDGDGHHTEVAYLFQSRCGFLLRRDRTTSTSRLSRN